MIDRNSRHERLAKTENLLISKPVLLSLIVLAVNTPVIFFMYPMRSLADEFHVFAIAAYFAGENWSSYMQSHVAYHGFGQALLYVPLFRIFRDPVMIYRGALLINSLLTATIPLLTDAIQHRILKLERTRFTAACALLTGLWPFYYSSSKVAWNEMIINVTFWLVAYLLLLFVYDDRSPKWLIGLLTGGTMAYVNATHGLTYALAAGVAISLLYAYRGKRNSGKRIGIVVGLFAAAAAYVAVAHLCEGVKDDLIHNLWNAKSLKNTETSFLSSIRKNYRDPKYYIMIFRVLCGELYYAAVTSFGLVFPAFILVCRALFPAGKRKSGQRSGSESPDACHVFCMLALLTFLIRVAYSSVSLGSGFMVNKGRADQLIYGRYVADLIPALLLAGAWLWHENKTGKKVAAIGAVCYAFLTAVFCGLVLPAMTAQPNTGSTSYTDLRPLLLRRFVAMKSLSYEKEQYDIAFRQNLQAVLTASLIGLAVYFLFLLFIRHRRSAAVLLLAAAFLYSDIYVSNVILIPDTAHQYEKVSDAAALFNGLKAETGARSVYYLTSKNGYDSDYQFVLPDYSVYAVCDPSDPNVTLQIEDLPENSYIMASEDVFLDCYYESIYLMEDTGTSETVFVKGEKLADELGAGGRKLTKRDGNVGLDLQTLEWSAPGTVPAGESLVLAPGESFESVGKTLPAGEYEVTITGEGLSAIDPEVHAQGTYLPWRRYDHTKYTSSRIVRQTDTECVMEVQLSQMLHVFKVIVSSDPEAGTAVIRTVTLRSISER
ncbi:MAG: hypothetical protein LKJ76_09640 [Lachnospiraceae bacterium]|nr:hypothetical protein [Lachnospiraceae bacterium]